MKGASLLSFLSVLNIISPTAQFLKQRLKRDTNADSLWKFPHEAIFKQKLDHFNLEDDRKFDQRYWVTVTHHRKNGPAFLFVSGQNSMDENPGVGFHSQGLIIARELNAICFSLEHRFYGKTWPMNDSKTIHYLSIGQALEDIANFIKYATEEFKLYKNTKWILIGCSYGAALSAWARFKYPQQIYAAVASGPALLAKVDYSEYYQIVESSLKAYSPKCIESITRGIEEIARSKNFSQLLYLCENAPKDSVVTIRNILVEMINIFSAAVQNGITDNFTIATVCEVMNNNNGSELKAFTELRKIYKKSRQGGLSMELENQRKRVLLLINYQRCSEFGFFSSFYNTTYLSAVKNLFPIEAEIKYLCEEFYGPNFGVKELNEKINRTNSLYGGLDFNAEKVIFIYGSLDPWYKAGLYKKKNDSLFETIFIKGISHCDDSILPSDVDIPELKSARQRILKILKMWLKGNSVVEQTTAVFETPNESL